MRWLALLACSILLTIETFCPRQVLAVGIAGFDSCGIASPESDTAIDSLDFHQYKVSALRSTLANRDLEFHWSDKYAAAFGRPLNAFRAGTDTTDLELLGLTLCSRQSTGAFGFPIPFIQLIYDYLRAPVLGRPANDQYETDPAVLTGFVPVGVPYADLDRSHVDAYVFVPPFSSDPLYSGVDFPGDGWYPGGRSPLPQFPSWFVDDEEDASTGHSGAPLDRNSISIPGPRPSQVGQVGSSDWTIPHALAPIVFNHEFQHMINNADPNRPLTEIFSHAAEALTGEHPGAPGNDVAYRWGLRRSGLNYEAYRSFSAYLTYNFRGLDQTFAGKSDDLIWRWARSSDRNIVSGLGQQLLTEFCAECSTATRTYFNGLSATDRINLLIHNWRVANYVNKPSLAEGQYGYPPQFGFDPFTDLGSWQNIDPSPQAADSFNIEMEVKLNSSHLTRELSLAGRPTTEVLTPANAHTMALALLGSEYWVVRSDPSLWNANRDLVIRVMPEGNCKSRLMATAVAYSEQDVAGQPDSLWNHPEWIQLVVPPKWVDVYTLNGNDTDPIELVVPNFGLTHKAALVVITLGDLADSGPNYDDYVLPYRMNLSLRVAPFQSPNPAQVTTYSDDFHARNPTWSPNGDEIAFSRASQVYRVSVSGGTPTLLFPQLAIQTVPDWSPRGDWVSFSQSTIDGGIANPPDIWAVDPYSGQSRQLTSWPDQEYGAVFSPNGQQLVYLRVMAGGRTQLRRVNVDGTNDIPLLDRTGVVFLDPRWAPNGPSVYLARCCGADSLYAIDAAGPQLGTVTAIAQLPPGGTHFDPPRGSGRWVWDVEWRPRDCLDLQWGTSRRLALRDSPTDLMDETVFPRPNSAFVAPRWSWDGTRIAYHVSQDVKPDTLPDIKSNIYVAQISYNHAPSFVNLNDQIVGTGVSFQLEVNASDPDGESLTYEAPAAFLPPGATFDANTRRLTWPAPGPEGAEYFIVFRALDPSGAVAHRVIRFQVTSGGAGGCPFVDTHASTGWQEENSVLSRSLTGALARDAYRLKVTPEVRAGRVSIRIRENEQEYTTLDEARLVAVDHAPDVRAYSVGDRMFLGTRVPAYSVTTSVGADVTASVSGTGSFYWGSPGDTLLVQITAPRVNGMFGANDTQDGGGGEGGMEGDPKEMEAPYSSSRPALPTNASAVDGAVLASTGILVEVPDGAGGWRKLTHYYPRRYRDEAVLDSLGSGSCRLIFLGRHRLYFVGRYARSATVPSPQVLDLLAARHSRLGSVKGAVRAIGGAATLLTPGDTLALEFGAAPLAPGQVRDYFLFATGVYSSTAPLAQGRESGREAAPVPTRFALSQNQPNPFERVTTIRFELPRETAVRLEVFDLQGRRVAILADGPLPAGFHSVDWDRRDLRGALARQGVYIYRLTAGEFRDQKKMLLFR